MSLISSATLTVNAAFLQEIKEVNQDLWRLLAEVRGKCARPQDIRADRPSFLAMLDDLRDQLALHFALEEAYGYFEDPVHVAPQLCERAFELRAEHSELYMQISRIAEDACDLVHSDNEHAGRILRSLVAAFERFDALLQRHESREIELMFQEYGDDIGVGD